MEEARKLDAAYIEKRFLESGMMMGPVIDGIYQVGEYSDLIRENKLNPVPIMTGNTTNEFMVTPPAEDEEAVKSWIKDSFGPYADEYLAICRRIVEKENIPLSKAAAVGSFELGVQLALEYFKKQGRTPYYYIFGPTIPGDDAGAFHSSDLWFEFETLMKCWRPFDGHHYDLARKMCNYWTNFAKTGNPNGKDADGVPMPPVDPLHPGEPPKPSVLRPNRHVCRALQRKAGFPAPNQHGAEARQMRGVDRLCCA